MLVIKQFIANNALALWMAAALALAGASFAAGFQVADWRSSAKENKGLQQQIVDQQRNDQDGREAAKGLQQQAAKTEIIYRIKREKVYATTTDSYCLGGSAVSLWNESLSGAEEDSTGAVESPGRTDTPEAEGEEGEYGATDREVLDNQIQNAKLWKDQRDQLNAIIDFEEGKP